MPKTKLVPKPPLPDLDDPMVALQTQLALARTMNAYLHRELATALKRAPMAPVDGTPSELLSLEIQDLRQRLGTLTLHYEDAQRRIREIQMYRDMAFKVLGWRVEDKSVLAPSEVLVDEVLTQLLTVAHPDKWAQGQPATELAHELTIALNAARARLSAG